MDTENVPFGGQTVLLGGDMAQILPVVKGLSAIDIQHHALPSWSLWHLRKRLTMTRNMRARDDAEFAVWLASVRDGSANIDGGDYIRVPEHMLVQAVSDEVTAKKKTQKKGDACDERHLIGPMIDKVI
jgi:hypothetical protein